MKNILAEAKNIHCIGIGGTGLSALAGVLRAKGKQVSGSDATIAPHHAENIPNDTQLVIYSAAVPDENVERMAAKSRGITQLSYPEALGLVTEEFRTIAICGTHGKTTTTAMTATILQNLIDPTVLVGASVPELGDRNYRVGKGDTLIIEACEYHRHFLHYTPTIVAITNIEIDHLDYFEDEDDYRDAFTSFLLRTKENGVIVANEDDPNVMKVCAELAKERPDLQILPYGRKHPEFHQFHLAIPGEHNVYNAAAALLAAQEATDINQEEAIEQLNEFKGTGRRFEQFLSSNGKVIIDDYAHHPTAIHATLKAARHKFGPDKRILCVFQPHQHSRTIKLLKSFIQSFHDADEVIIPNIFQVRDSQKDVKEMSAETFVSELQRHHPNAHYGHGLEKTTNNILSRLDEFDVILVMGAGDVTKIAKALKQELTLSST